MKCDHRSNFFFSNLSNWKEEAWKNQGFNGIRTHDLRDIGAMLYQLSYEATHWEQGQFIELSKNEQKNQCGKLKKFQDFCPRDMESCYLTAARRVKL